jgi:hypothetical protein
MPASKTIAVEATDKKYFGLKHMPGGRPLDKDGKGAWPADQFTFRLIQEGSLKEQGTVILAAGETAVGPFASGPATQIAPSPGAAPVEVNPLTHLSEIVTEAQHEIEQLQGAAGKPPAKA